MYFCYITGLFSSYPKPLFQNETKREAIDVTMIFYSLAQKTYFHKKGLLIGSFWNRGFIWGNYDYLLDICSCVAVP